MKMRLWLVIASRSLVAVAAALVFSILTATVVVFASGQDSPAVGILWFLVAFIAAGLSVPIAIAFAIESVEHDDENSRASFSKGFLRVILGWGAVFPLAFVFLT